MARPAEFDRELVLNQAKELFWSQGYRATTINKLVRATGMQPGSLYAAFKSKEELFLQVIDRYTHDLLANLHAILNQHPSPLAAVGGFLDFIYRQASNADEWKGCLLVNSMVEFSHKREGKIPNRLRNAYVELEQIFTEQFNMACAQGELDNSADPQAMASYLLTCLWGINAIRSAQPDNRKLAAILAIISKPLL